MMWIRSFLLTFCLSVTISVIHAQTVADAERYATYDYVGPARVLSVGGAMSAIGANFGTLSTNPAGLGWYRSMELTFSPSITINNFSPEFVKGNTSSALDQDWVHGDAVNFGLVISGGNLKGELKRVNFALGFNSLGLYDQQYNFEGQNTGSIVHRWLDLANSDFGLDDFESGLASDVEAIYDSDSDGIYESDFESRESALLDISQNVKSAGSQSEFLVGMSGNFNDKLLIGGAVGIPNISFRQEKVYRESDPGGALEGNVPFFDNLAYSETLETSGTGFNIKLGAIYRLTQAIRLGLAVHTPTWYQLEDNFSSTLDYDFEFDGDQIANFASSPEGFFEYQLTTPWRVIGSAGYIVGQSGFISTEIELVDYSSTKFRYNGFKAAEREINGDIAQQLDKVMNLRVGGEYVYRRLRIRGGLGLHGAANTNNDWSTSYSGGLGYRGTRFFVDVGYRFHRRDEQYRPYLTGTSSEQVIDLSPEIGTLVFTIGLK